MVVPWKMAGRRIAPLHHCSRSVCLLGAISIASIICLSFYAETSRALDSFPSITQNRHSDILTTSLEKPNKPKRKRLVLCPLPVCRLHGISSPILFLDLRITDDTEGDVIGVLEGLAIAAKNGMNFGGLYTDRLGSDGAGFKNVSEFYRVVNGFFGMGLILEPSACRRIERFSAEFANVIDLEKDQKQYPSNSLILLSTTEHFPYSDDKAVRDYFSESLMAALRGPLADRPLHFESTAPGGAVLYFAPRSLKQSGFLHVGEAKRVVDEVRKLVPEVDAHCWTMQKKTLVNDRLLIDERGQKTLVESAIVEHVGDDLLEAWTHVARAKVLAVSASPRVASALAKLSPNCAFKTGKEVDKLLDIVRDCVSNAWPGLVKEEKLVYCQLPICNFHGPEAPRLFCDEHVDGVGHRIKNTVDGMAAARYLGMNFGGIRAAGNFVTEHGQNTRLIADGIFGAGSSRAIFVNVVKYKCDHIYNNVPELWKHRGKVKNGESVWVGPCQDGTSIPDNKWETYFTSDFRNLVYRQLEPRVKHFARGRPSVAVHARRGDLVPTDARATVDEYYYDLIDRVKSALPDADVHLWSSVNSKMVEFTGGKSNWNISSFDGYRNRNISVHLDGGLLEPWAHMAMADVFIAASSSFSFVPAIFNKNCVIMCCNDDYHGYPWVAGRAERARPLGEELKRCLSRVSSL